MRRHRRGHLRARRGRCLRQSRRGHLRTRRGRCLRRRRRGHLRTRRGRSRAPPGTVERVDDSGHLLGLPKRPVCDAGDELVHTSSGRRVRQVVTEHARLSEIGDEGFFVSVARGHFACRGGDCLAGRRLRHGRRGSHRGSASSCVVVRTFDLSVWIFLPEDVRTSCDVRRVLKDVVATWVRCLSNYKTYVFEPVPHQLNYVRIAAWIMYYTGIDLSVMLRDGADLLFKGVRRARFRCNHRSARENEALVTAAINAYKEAGIVAGPFRQRHSRGTTSQSRRSGSWPSGRAAQG
ncbi:hypothetical protein T492DRAFT_358396 [Pavlovales sp. CCMP2436]|nr:hypothetical protein T492DRAFT_358396 [Pavlovales sp. CCMP2436]